MSFMDRVKTEAAEGGFKQHPLGVFPAQIEDVAVKDVTGKDGNLNTIYELHLRTSVATAKVGYFKTTLADVEDLFRGQCASREEAEERYIKTLGKVVRLYTDLGVEAPSGVDDLEFEYNVYEQLGRLNNAQCSLVVQENRRDPSKGPVMFINAPRSDGRPAGGGKTSLERKAQAAAPKAAAGVKRAAPARGAPQDLGDIDVPF